MGVKKTSRRKKFSPLPLFVVFFFLALATVILLEYLDFQRGKASFIFDEIISLERKIPEDPAVRRVNRELFDFLKNRGISYSYFRDKKNQYHFKIEIEDRDIKEVVTGMERIIARSDFSIRLSEFQKKPGRIVALYQLKKDARITHVFLISGDLKKEEIPREMKEGMAPMVAFIIDDIGNRQGMAVALKRLNIPITAAILPDSSYAFDEARQIRQYGLQCLIHLPMQPKNSRHHPTSPSGVIRTDSKPGQIREIIQRATKTIPTARGLNNHEGSLVTSDRETITRILRVVKEEGLFFIDSRTAVDTVAFEVARKLNIKTAFRDVFLDSVKSYSHSRQQIKKLISIARKKGSAIAIGHPFQSTLDAIRDSIPGIREKGIKIVFVSEMVE